jgi:serine/threonine protein kinase
MRRFTPLKVSSYKVLQSLGEGLSSIVYKAIREDGQGLSEQTVVLKVLKSENAVRWLKREFDALKKIESAHCVRVLGWENFSEGPALVLEFIEGVTLYELGQNFLLGEPLIQQIESHVVSGLKDLASANLFHGDLNPQNILIDRWGRAKLIDFGSLPGQDAAELVGTPAYMSKFAWQNEVADLQSDLQSWQLIKIDLQSQFQNIPICENAARLRAESLCESSEFNQEVCSAAQAQVAQLVSDLLLRKQNLGQTKVLTPTLDSGLTAGASPVARSLRRSLASALALSLLVSAVPVRSSFQLETQKQEFGSLQIRTLQWAQVSMDHQSEVYTPARWTKLSAGRHLLKWHCGKRSGQIAFVLKPQETKVFTDQSLR